MKNEKLIIELDGFDDYTPVYIEHEGNIYDFKINLTEYKGKDCIMLKTKIKK